MNPNEPVNPPPDPLVNLEGAVATANQEAKAPIGQFASQFGSGVTPPVAEVPADASVANLDPSIKTVDDLLAKGPQVVENPNPAVEAVPAEQTPAENLKKQISDSIDAFLAEVTKEKVAA